MCLSTRRKNQVGGVAPKTLVVYFLLLKENVNLFVCSLTLREVERDRDRQVLLERDSLTR